jgi:predicted ABC-type sugar transport system permease subunit
MTELTRPQPLASKLPRLRDRFKGFSLGEAGIYYALAMVWAVLTFFTVVLDVQNFLDPANLANILYQASFVAIIAVPMTLVLISGNFDLSVASTAAISAACVLLLSDQLGIYPAIAISLAAGVLIGFINAAVVQGLGINAFIVTLATMTTLRGVLLIITGGHTASADDREALAPLKWIENGVWTPPNLFWCGGAAALIAAALLWWRRRAVTPLIWAGVGLVLVVAGFFFDAIWPLAKPVYYMAAVTAVAWCVTRFTIIGPPPPGGRRQSRSSPAHWHQHQPLSDRAIRAQWTRSLVRRTFVRRAAGRGAAERHVGDGAHGHYGCDPRRHLVVRRFGKCIEIRHRRSGALQPGQRLRHPRPWYQLSGSHRGRGADHRRSDLHDRQSRPSSLK